MSHSDVLLGEVDTLRRLRRHRAGIGPTGPSGRYARPSVPGRRCSHISNRPRKHLSRLDWKRPGKVLNCSVSTRGEC